MKRDSRMARVTWPPPGKRRVIVRRHTFATEMRIDLPLLARRHLKILRLIDLILCKTTKYIF